MKTMRIYQLNHLAPMLFRRLKEAQMEAAQVWNGCMETHKAARQTHSKWPGRNELQQATKGHFMHELAFGHEVKFPRSFTYLRPSSSRAGTPQSCLSKSTAQPRLVETVSLETAIPLMVFKSPSPFRGRECHAEHIVFRCMTDERITL
jgi:hypothetical protein